MSLTCFRQTPLEFMDSKSDKLYIIQIQQDGASYKTVCYYGRRGATLTATEKYTGSSLAAATAQFDKSEREKRSKGYTTLALATGAAPAGMPAGVPVFGGAAVPGTATPTATPTVPTGLLPMLATELKTEEGLVALIEDPDACLQKKQDGERLIVSLRRTGIVGTNRKGLVRPIPASAEIELKKLLALSDFSDDRETVLDGEILQTGEFVAYDTLILRGNDIRSLSFLERFCSLEELLSSQAGLICQTAWTTAEKRALREQAVEEEWEGMMGRDNTAPYVAGRGKAIVKIKLWATVTCRVLSVNSKRSVQVGLRDEADHEVFSGNVSVPVDQAIPKLDGLIEVRYLYALPGGSLYQPTMLRERDDVDQCDLRSGLRSAPPEKLTRLRKSADAKAAEEALVV